MKTTTTFAALAACTLLTAAQTASAQSAGGFFVETQALHFEWSDTDGDDSQADRSTGYRLTGGYRTATGHIIRARHFSFTGEDDDSGDELKIRHTDLEYGRAFSLADNFTGEVSVGARFSSLETPQPRTWTSLNGPVLGIGFESGITDRFGVYGAAHYAYLFGEEEEEGNEHPIGMSELAAGVQYTQALGAGDLVVRAGVEGQYYQSVRDDEEDYGLLGLTLSGGFTF